MNWLRRAFAWALHRYFIIVCPVCEERVRFWKGEVATWAVGRKKGRWTCKTCHTDITLLVGGHEFAARARRGYAALREKDPVEDAAPIETPVAGSRKEVN